MVLDILLLVAGLALLVLGAHWLVKGASRLALAVGLSPLVIGLTVVAFGTSAPELAVSLKAGLGGHADMAVGNVVGSNIFNILFILGVSALAAPLAVSSRLIRLDVPVMIGVTGLLWAVGLDRSIGRLEGGVFLLGMAAYTLFQVRLGRKEARVAGAGEGGTATPGGDRSPWSPLVLVAVGLAALVLGSGWLVDGSSGLARALGVGELAIGLTIVAAGTSMPELATSVVAGLRGERDIAVGNVVGSNIFNILGILGLTGLVAQGGLTLPQQVVGFDLPVMAGAAVACLPVFITGSTVSRAEGGLLLASYVLYSALLALKAMGSPYFLHLGRLAAWTVLPVAAVILIASLAKTLARVSRLARAVDGELDAVLRASLIGVRKLVVVATGGTILLVGLVMVVLPGPAVLVIPLGLAILGTEFAWAKRLLVRVQNRLGKAFPKVAARFFGGGR